MTDAQASRVSVRAYTVEEFAERWRISRGFVYKLAKKGDLNLTKILGRTVITVEAEAAFAKKLGGEAA